MKHKILKKEINQLKKRYGNHVAAAEALGIDARYYRRIRNERGLLVSKLMRLQFDRILSNPKDLII